jgi:hypothetical protein
MFRIFAASALLLSALSTASSADSLFAGGPRYDGTVKLVKLVGTSCPPGQGGQVYPAVYRAKVKPLQPVEAINVGGLPLAGAIIIAAEGDGTFKGANQAFKSGFIIDAWHGVGSAGVTNFNFTPNTITETTTSFTFAGTISNYTFKNCTATVKGNFTLR